MTIQKKTAHGSLWNLARTLSGNGIDFVVYAMLARVLTIEDFALLIFCLLLVEFASIFPRFGVAQNLIQRSRWEQDYASSTFCFITVLSLLVSILLVVIGSSVAYFVHSEQAVYVIFVLSIIPFLTGMHNIFNAKLEREFKQFEITVINIVANLIAGLTAIWLILSGWGLWALVVNRVLSNAILLVLFAWRSKFIPWFKINFGHTKELKAFCLPLLATAILEYCDRKASNFYAALVLGSSAFALMSIAKKCEEVAVQSTLMPINKMVIPSLSRLADNSKPQAFYRLMEMSAYIVIPGFLGLGVLAEQFVTLAFGDNYTTSAELLTIYCLAIAAHCLTWFLVSLLISVAKTKAALQLRIINTSATIMIGAIAVNFGLHSLIVALVVSAYLLLPLKYYLVAKHVNISLKHAVTLILPPSLCGGLMMGIVMYAETLFNTMDLSAFWELLILAALGCVTYVGLLFMCFYQRAKTQLSRLTELFT